MAKSPVAKKLSNSFAYRFNKFAGSVDPHYTLRLNGQEFEVPLIDTLGEGNIQLKENDWFLKMLRAAKLPPDTDFIDIGANVGQTLLAFRSLYPNTYWGFEPNANCIFYLEKLIKDNHFTDVHVLPVGLATKNGLAKFYIKHIYDTGASLMNETRPGYYAADQVKYVPVFSLDELKLDTKKVSLIKIDVEMAELEVIGGMLQTIRQHQPMIICEVLDYFAEESGELTQGRANALMAHIRSLNYTTYRILHSGESIQYELVESILLKKHTEASYHLNDYLFLPAGAALPQ